MSVLAQSASCIEFDRQFRFLIAITRSGVPSVSAIGFLTRTNTHTHTRTHTTATVRGFEDFTADLLPARVERVECKGKFIYMVCVSESSGRHGSIWSTLGMSGRWSLQKTDHSRVKLLFDEGKGRGEGGGGGGGGVGAGATSAGSGSRELYYTDPRNFGTLTFSLEEAELRSKVCVCVYVCVLV